MLVIFTGCPVVMYVSYSELHFFVLNPAVKHLLIGSVESLQLRPPSVKSLLFHVRKMRGEKGVEKEAV